MKLSVSAFRAQASAHKKILSTSWITPMNYGGSSSKDQTKVRWDSFIAHCIHIIDARRSYNLGLPRLRFFFFFLTWFWKYQKRHLPTDNLLILDEFACGTSKIICRPEPSKFSSFTCPGPGALRTRHSKSLQVLFI